MANEIPIDAIQLEDYTGQGFQNYMQSLVDNEDSWAMNKVYKFMCSDGNDFTITAKGTSCQPGNGLVEFSNTTFDRPSWQSLQPVVSNTDFPEVRENFLNQNLANQTFDQAFAANVLMSFEIARRVKSLPAPACSYPYQISREQTIEAIDLVMSSPATQYPTQTKNLIDMFAAKGDSQQETYDKRKKAYDQIIEMSLAEKLGDMGIEGGKPTKVDQ